MRTAVAAGLVAGSLVVWLGLGLGGGPSDAMAQRSASPQGSGSGEWIAFQTPLGENQQQLTVLDPATRTLSVYHVDGSSGSVTLKSVRNIHWDMQLLEFNGTSPRPQEIRAMAPQR